MQCFQSTSGEPAVEKYDQEDNIPSPRTSEISAGFDLQMKVLYCNKNKSWKQQFSKYFQSSSLNLSLDLMSRRKDLPDDLACFLQQQKQRQARLETTMRSFPSRGDMDMEKLEAKKKKNIHEVRSC